MAPRRKLSFELDSKSIPVSFSSNFCKSQNDGSSYPCAVSKRSWWSRGTFYQLKYISNAIRITAWINRNSRGKIINVWLNNQLFILFLLAFNGSYDSLIIHSDLNSKQLDHNVVYHSTGKNIYIYILPKESSFVKMRVFFSLRASF